jgi:hypothetical protein
VCGPGPKNALRNSKAADQRKEDSPHLLLNKIKSELYYAVAETDRAVPAQISGELKRALDKVNTKYEPALITASVSPSAPSKTLLRPRRLDQNLHNLEPRP